MTGSREFESMIGPVITRYLDLKRSLGQRADTLRYHLDRFDRFLASQDAEDLTRESFAAWCSSFEHLACSTRRQRMRVVYHLCLYRRREEPNCFLPDPGQFPAPKPRPQPHIFSQEELMRILSAADALKSHPASPLHRQVARLAVVLLYTAGLRLGELVALALGDYDSSSHV